jgi:hypothetical protein
MSALEALRAARIAGIQLGVDGEDLVLTASVPPPGAVIDLLARFKTEDLALLRPTGDGWSAEDWHAFFDERAGMGEFDGGLPRAEAEIQALACCVTEWLNHNPVYSPAGHCLGCGNPEYAHDPLVPFGTESTGHAWLHSRMSTGSPAAYRPAPHLDQMTTRIVVSEFPLNRHQSLRAGRPAVSISRWKIMWSKEYALPCSRFRVLSGARTFRGRIDSNQGLMTQGPRFTSPSRRSSAEAASAVR